MVPRFFGHGELHLALLALLVRQPMHGYELMASLERMLGPSYRPSAGSIYPALNSLVAEGLLQRRASGQRQLYELTPTGRRALEQRSVALAALEIRAGVRFNGAGRLDGLLAHFAARLAVVAPFVDADAIAAILDTTAGDIERLATTSANKEQA